ncbi:hypothetical protein, partial [Ralstonia pseudosolanacearum]|uniref:hypothetical protein n=1 Tax=Ralstonia pseudosolanacearum TaxID=1310165 RepID=UPI003AAC8B90
MLTQASATQPSTNRLFRLRSDCSEAERLSAGLGSTLMQSAIAKTAQQIKHAATTRPWDWILFMRAGSPYGSIASVGKKNEV